MLEYIGPERARQVSSRGAEAGGHIGPVATSILAQEILPHIEDVPVFRNELDVSFAIRTPFRHISLFLLESI